jgi:hypothetical protein
MHTKSKKKTKSAKALRSTAGGISAADLQNAKANLKPALPTVEVDKSPINFEAARNSIAQKLGGKAFDPKAPVVE